MMNPSRQRKLLSIVLVMAVILSAALLIMYALRQNISLFYSPSQVAHGEVKDGRSIRVGGMVVPGSIHRGLSDLSIEFAITDHKETIDVVYTGVLPDLFAEGKGVVAQGTYSVQSKQFKASEILAKHDENYMPPEVKAILSEPKPQPQPQPSLKDATLP